MKKTLLCCLLFSSVSLAKETIHVGVQGGYVRKDRPSIKSGSLMLISASTENGETFFSLPIKTNVVAGVMSSTTKKVSYKKPYVGVEKEVVFAKNPTSLYASGFLGVGYKFTDLSGSNQDNLLPSRLHARIGAKLTYATKSLRTSVLYTHLSNGGLTENNIGYNFVGLEVQKRI